MPQQVITFSQVDSLAPMVTVADQEGEFGVAIDKRDAKQTDVAGVPVLVVANSQTNWSSRFRPL